MSIRRATPQQPKVSRLDHVLSTGLRVASIEMKRNLDSMDSRAPRSEWKDKTMIYLDQGKRLRGRDYDKMKEAIVGNLENVIKKWSVNLAKNKISINGNHFQIDMGEGKGLKSYECVTEDRPDRLKPKGKSLEEKKADAEARLRALLDEEEDLFYTVTISIMLSLKLAHFSDIQ